MKASFSQPGGPSILDRSWFLILAVLTGVLVGVAIAYGLLRCKTGWVGFLALAAVWNLGVHFLFKTLESLLFAILLTGFVARWYARFPSMLYLIGAFAGFAVFSCILNKLNDRRYATHGAPDLTTTSNKPIAPASED